MTTPNNMTKTPLYSHVVIHIITTLGGENPIRVSQCMWGLRHWWHCENRAWLIVMSASLDKQKHGSVCVRALFRVWGLFFPCWPESWRSSSIPCGSVPLPGWINLGREAGNAVFYPSFITNKRTRLVR